METQNKRQNCKTWKPLKPSIELSQLVGYCFRKRVTDQNDCKTECYFVLKKVSDQFVIEEVDLSCTAIYDSRQERFVPDPSTNWEFCDEIKFKEKRDEV